MKTFHAVAVLALAAVPVAWVAARERPSARASAPVECSASAGEGRTLFTFKAYRPFADQERRALCLLSSSVSASGLASLGSVWLDESTAGNSPLVVVGETYQCVATPVEGTWSSVQTPAQVRLEVSALPE